MKALCRDVVFVPYNCPVWKPNHINDPSLRKGGNDSPVTGKSLAGDTVDILVQGTRKNVELCLRQSKDECFFPYSIPNLFSAQAV